MWIRSFNRVSTSLALVLFLLSFVSVAGAEVPKAKVGQNVSVLLKGLLPRTSGVARAGCDFPIQYQVWSKHGAKDQDPSWDELTIYLPVGDNTMYRVVVTFDSTGDENTYTGDGVDVYVVNDSGVIVQVMPVADAPDDPCTLFVEHKI